MTDRQAQALGFLGLGFLIIVAGIGITLGTAGTIGGVIGLVVGLAGVTRLVAPSSR